ncbi:MAG: hypothetical protein ACJ744_09340 [Gaiellaceae bacterium]|jgi:hypothetical protein
MRNLHRTATAIFAVAFIAIGFALLIVTAVHGGGFVGFVLGALFIAAGAGRLYLLMNR